MFRARIGLAAAAVVAGLTIVVALMVGSSLTGAIQQQVRQTVEHAQSAFPALDRLRGLELTNDTVRLARGQRSSARRAACGRAGQGIGG